MSALRIITIAGSVLVAIASAAAWAGAPQTLAELTREDGIAEYGSALLYLVAAVLFVQAGLRGGLRRLWTWGLGALVFLVAGEEISWGQRIIGVSTPDSLAAVNVQSELNLHNIDGLHQNVRMLAMLFVLGVCFAMPLGHRLMAPVRELFDKLRLPIFPLWALPSAVLAVAFMVVPRLQGQVVFELDEIGELLLSVSMAAFAASARHTSRLDHEGAQQPAPVVAGST